jgi:transcriptional regulator with XRE-family HTH domain
VQPLHGWTDRKANDHVATDPEATPPPDVLGSYIRTQRQLADLSLRQLAEISSVSNAYLSQIERGLHQPSLKVLRSIASALNLSRETLMTQAGLLDDEPHRTEPHRAESATGTEAAILADPDLTDEEKQVIVGIYRQFLHKREE